MTNTNDKRIPDDLSIPDFLRRRLACAVIGLALGAATMPAAASTLHIERLPATCSTDSDCIRLAFDWGCTESVTEDHDADGNEDGTYTSHGFNCSLSRFIAKAKQQTR